VGFAEVNVDVNLNSVVRPVASLVLAVVWCTMFWMFQLSQLSSEQTLNFN